MSEELARATAWALDRISEPTPTVKWLSAVKPMFLRDMTEDEVRLQKRVNELEAGVRNLLYQADYGRSDLIGWYIRTVASDLGVA